MSLRVVGTNANRRWACSVMSVNAYGVCLAKSRMSAMNERACSADPNRVVRPIVVFWVNSWNPNPTCPICLASIANPANPVRRIREPCTDPNAVDVLDEDRSDSFATCSCALVARRM